MTTLRIARRNLGRNFRRTFLGLFAITLAQAGVLLMDGLMNGYTDAMVDAFTGPMLGHVQVHAHDYREQQSMDLTIAHLGDKLSQLRGLPEAPEASARIYAPVLVALGEQGFMGVVVGLQPKREAGARGLLGTRPELTNLRSDQVLIGKSLAHRMNVKAGDELAIVGQAADGSIANDLYEVAGLLPSPVELVESTGLIMTLPAAQSLFVMDDEAHEITLHGADPDGAPHLAASIGGLPSFGGLEIKRWDELAPELTSMLQMTSGFTWILLLLVFVAAAAGVANTMLMAAFERNHELGMLLALGCSPQRIVGMLTLEALLLGALGAGLGTTLGIAGNALLASSGVDFAGLGGAGNELQNLSLAGMNFGVVVFPRTSFQTVASGLSAVIVTSLLASLWPALHAATLQPVEAMRA